MNGSNIPKTKTKNEKPPNKLFVVAILAALMLTLLVSMVVPGNGFVPGDAKSHFETAARDAQKGMLKEEVLELEKAVSLDPKFIPAYGPLGLCYMAEKSYGKAAWAFRFATVLEPQNPANFLNLGIASLQAGRPKDALSALDNAARLPSADPAFYQTLAQAYSAAGDSKHAKIFGQKSRLIRKNPLAGGQGPSPAGNPPS